MNYPIVMRLQKRFDKNFKVKVKKETDNWAEKFLSINPRDTGGSFEKASRWMLEHYDEWEKYTMRQCLALGIDFEKYWGAYNEKAASDAVLSDCEDRWSSSFEKFVWDFYSCSSHMTSSNILAFIVFYNKYLIRKNRIEMATRKRNDDE